MPPVDRPQVLIISTQEDRLDAPLSTNDRSMAANRMILLALLAVGVFGPSSSAGGGGTASAHQGEEGSTRTRPLLQPLPPRTTAPDVGASDRSMIDRSLDWGGGIGSIFGVRRPEPEPTSTFFDAQYRIDVVYNQFRLRRPIICAPSASLLHPHVSLYARHHNRAATRRGLERCRQRRPRPSIARGAIFAR